jgi:CYTH domain-containing protein
MAAEIERKFLVTGDGWRSAASRQRTIRQAYLAITSTASVRVRIVDGTAARLTVKSAAAGAQRDEFDYAIPLVDAEAMLPLCSGQVIDKQRYDVAFSGRIWEVDVFGGALAGLVIAECELGDAGETLACPDWVGQEVTGDRRYSNAALSRDGRPDAQ